MTPLVPTTLVVIVSIAVPMLSIYLSAAAMLLNRSFNAQARRSATAQEPLATRVRPLVALYGAHLLLFIALGYLVLALTILIAIDVFPAALWLISQFASASLAMMLLPSAALMVAALSLWAVFHGLLARDQRARDFELSVDLYRQGPLYAICAEVAAAVGTTMVDRVVLSGRPGLSVREEGRLLDLLVGRSSTNPGRRLTLGHPSKRRPVSGAAGPRARPHLESRRRLDLTNLPRGDRGGIRPEQDSAEPAAGRLATLLTLLNPTHLLMIAYAHLYQHLTAGFSQIRETLAYDAACELYGPRAFGQGIRRAVLNDALFNLMFGVRLPRFAEQTVDVPARAFVALDREYRTTSTHQLLVLWQETISQPPSRFDPIRRARSASAGPRPPRCTPTAPRPARTTTSCASPT